MDEITSELQAIDFTHDANDPHLGQPNISKSQLYAHHPLNSTSFRLLTILPGEGHEGIVCTLSTTSLYTQISYKALSYVWGEVIHQNCIIVSGCRFNVTVNLYNGLLRLRDPKRFVRLWVDAICINQEE